MPLPALLLEIVQLEGRGLQAPQRQHALERPALGALPLGATAAAVAGLLLLLLLRRGELRVSICGVERSRCSVEQPNKWRYTHLVDTIWLAEAGRGALQTTTANPRWPQHLLARPRAAHL